MPVGAPTNVESETYVLRLHDPDPNQWRLDGLSAVLSDLDFLYRFSCEINLDVLAVRRADFEFVHSPYFRDVSNNGLGLAVLQLNTGSLFLELAEWVHPANLRDLGITVAAAYSFRSLIKLLQDGPEKLVKWSSVVLDAKLRRIERMGQIEATQQLHGIRTLREKFEQEALMLEARQRLIRLHASMPDLEATIFNHDDGSEVLPPTLVFELNTGDKLEE